MQGSGITYDLHGKTRHNKRTCNATPSEVEHNKSKGKRWTSTSIDNGLRKKARGGTT